MKIWPLLVYLFSICLCWTQGSLAQANYLSTSLSGPDLEQKITELISQMTLEEKLGQLQQLDGTADGAYRPEHVEMIQKGLLGSTLNVRGVHNTNYLQHIAMDMSRLKIPVLFAFDVIHGYRTIFPVPLAEASSWDPSLVESSASAAAFEASSVGLKWTFAPMVDIARDPRWGRIVEGAGEDPYLGSAMARAGVHGFQGDDFSAPTKIMACAKHWVGYGAAFGGRDYDATEIPENTLREIYFPPFKAALDAGVGTFMSAFNSLNGVPASANLFTLTQVLKGEWNFQGFVVSDYKSVEELIQHGLASNGAEAARDSLMAGLDMEMVSTLFSQNVPALIQGGRLMQSTIDAAVRRILRVKWRLGLFDHPYTNDVDESTALNKPEYKKLARVAAARSMVLLKNSNSILPLRKNMKSIAVIGPLANDQQSPLGPWNGDGQKNSAVSVLAGIRAAVGHAGVKINYVKGCDIADNGNEEIAKAVQAAKNSQVAVLVLGESGDMSGEATSRSQLDLPGRQLDLLKAVVATKIPVVVVLMNGRPLTIEWTAQHATAILETWFGGSEAGDAIADVLFGDVNPGGKLPVTFPRAVGQIPIFYNERSTGRPADPANKYTSKYIDLASTPLFPFGYGLSFTKFKLGNLSLDKTEIKAGEKLKVSVDLTNIGPVQGDEVVQLYVHEIAASVTRPIKELKGFQRVTLKPGEVRHIEFLLNYEDLGFYDTQMHFGTEPGKFSLTVGTSSTNGIISSFEAL